MICLLFVFLVVKKMLNFSALGITDSVGTELSACYQTKMPRKGQDYAGGSRPPKNGKINFLNFNLKS